MKIVGIRNVDFTAQDGSHIVGVSLYCSYEITRNGAGYAVDKVFVSENKLRDVMYRPEVGDEIVVNYNRFGKVESISPLNN